MAISEAGIDIEIREARAVRGARVIRRSLDDIGKDAIKTERQVDRLNAETGRLGSTFRTTAVGVRSLQTAFVANAGSLLLRELVRTTDQMSLLKSRLKLVTDGVDELAFAQRELFRVSQDTRTEFSSNVDLFSSLSRATKNLGIEQTALVALTENTAKAISVSGSSAQAGAASIVQFGQALTGNFKSSAQELNSILEQSSRLAEAVADGLNETGVTANVAAADLKRLAEDGVLNTSNVINALLSQTDELNKEFVEVERTVGGALTQLANSFDRAAGFANDGAGATKGLTTAIDELRSVVESPEFQSGLSLLLQTIAGIATLVAASIGQISKFVDEVERLSTVQGQLDASSTLLQGGPGAFMGNFARDKVLEFLNTSRTAVTVPVPPELLGSATGNGAPTSGPRTNPTVEGLKREIDQLRRVSEAVRENKAARDQVADAIEAENTLVKEEIKLSSSLADQIHALVAERNGLNRAIENQESKRALIVSTREEISALQAQAAALRVSEEEFRIITAAQEIFAQGTGLSAAKSVEMARSLVSAQTALDDLNEAMQRGRQLTEELRTPSERYLDTVAELERLLASGAIGQTTFNRALDRAGGDFRRATDSTRELQAAFDELGSTFQSAFEDAVVGGESLQEVLRGLGQDLARLGLRFAVTEPLFGGLRNGFNGEDSGAEGLGGLGEFLGGGLRDLFGSDTPLPDVAPTVAATVSGEIGGQIGGFGFPQADQFGATLAKQAESLDIFGQSVLGAGTSSGVLEAAQGGVSDVIGANVVPALAQQALGTATETTASQVATTALASFTTAVTSATIALQTMAAGSGGGSKTGQLLQLGLSIASAAAGASGSFFAPGTPTVPGTITGGGAGPGASPFGGGGANLLFASGGLVRGPGTSTSDSIRAQLSNGEFVVNARSASDNLGLLQAINDNAPIGQLQGALQPQIFDFAALRGSMEIPARAAAQNDAAARSFQAQEARDRRRSVEVLESIDRKLGRRPPRSRQEEGIGFGRNSNQSARQLGANAERQRRRN